MHQVFDDGISKLSVLNGIDFDVRPGELTAIAGASGAGKSTLLTILSGLSQPTSGKVIVDGIDLYLKDDAERTLLRNRTLGYVYQFPRLLQEFTAIENVSMPLLLRGERFPVANKEAEKILSHLGLQDRCHHKPSELSGGEKQRVALARAIVSRPKCILADEPTGSLDQKNADQLMQLIVKLNKELGLTFVLVTHDESIYHHMHRVFHLVEGKLNLQIPTSTQD